MRLHKCYGRRGPLAQMLSDGAEAGPDAYTGGQNAALATGQTTEQNGGVAEVENDSHR